MLAQHGATLHTQGAHVSQPRSREASPAHNLLIPVGYSTIFESIAVNTGKK